MKFNEKLLHAQHRVLVGMEMNAHRVQAAAMILTGVAIMAVAPEAMASASTAGDIAQNIAADGSKFMNAIIYGAYIGGGILAIMGIHQLIKKSNGDQQVTGASIAGHILGGGALAVAGGVLKAVSGTVGVDSSSAIGSFSRM